MNAQRAVWIAVVGLAGVLSGCAFMGGQRTTSSSERPKARYSAAAGVELHRAPDSSSEVVGKLGLHEGVLRYQVDGEFAYVVAEKSGNEGWVRERELIERLPEAKKTPAAAQPADTAAPAEPGPTEPAEPEPPPPPREKSVFDPY